MKHFHPKNDNSADSFDKKKNKKKNKWISSIRSVAAEWGYTSQQDFSLPTWWRGVYVCVCMCFIYIYIYYILIVFLFTSAKGHLMGGCTGIQVHLERTLCFSLSFSLFAYSFVYFMLFLLPPPPTTRRRRNNIFFGAPDVGRSRRHDALCARMGLLPIRFKYFFFFLALPPALERRQPLHAHQISFFFLFK